METGLILKGMRDLLDLKQENVAKDLNVTKGALSLYENNKRSVPNEIFIKACRLFEKESNSSTKVAKLLSEARKAYTGESNCFKTMLEDCNYIKDMLVIANENSIYSEKYTLALSGKSELGVVAYTISEDCNYVRAEEVYFKDSKLYIRTIAQFDYFAEELEYDLIYKEGFLEMSEEEKLQCIIEYGEYWFDSNDGYTEKEIVA